MSFGPYKLVQVKVEGGALVLELADETGQIVFRPRRLSSYYGHELILAKAKELEGKQVITTTIDSRKNPPKFWWIDVDEYQESASINRSTAGSSATDQKVVTRPPSTLASRPEATVASENQLANLLKKYAKK